MFADRDQAGIEGSTRTHPRLPRLCDSASLMRALFAKLTSLGRPDTCCAAMGLQTNVAELPGRIQSPLI